MNARSDAKKDLIFFIFVSNSRLLGGNCFQSLEFLLKNVRLALDNDVSIATPVNVCICRKNFQN